jgi:hypothetical protein
LKKLSILLCCLLLPLAMTAQERTGNINGTVVDKDNVPLPGVTLTLTGPTIAPMTAVSNAEGRFRFLSLHPGDQFDVKAELQGFKTRTEKGVIINVGKNADIRVVMEQGTLEEQVTVVAQTPMVQAKKTQVTNTVGYEQLQSLPSARDPWVVLQLTPGLYIDRENIGGNESGQQSSFVNKGSTTQEWTLDGVQITDLSSGGSPGYFDFDAFEEMNISTGSLDVEHRSPGTVINLVTRRGGNKTSVAGRFYMTDGQFQGTIADDKIKSLGLAGYNHIRAIEDMGINIGGPVWKDKVWWWGSYSLQQVKTIVATGTNDDSYLTNLDFKINLQLIPQNRAEFYIQAGKKEKFGRSSSVAYPPGWNQYGKYHFGSPTIKFQDEHMFGDSLFVSARYGYTDAGFGMWPAGDEKMATNTWYNSEKGVYDAGPAGGKYGQTWWFSGRPHTFAVAQIQYFNDNIFGTSHEIKLGFEMNNNSATSVAYFYGSKIMPNWNYNSATLDFGTQANPAGDGVIDIMRDRLKVLYPTNTPTYARFTVSRSPWASTTGTDRYSGYFSDLINVGRLNINLGVRADRNNNYAKKYTAEALLEAQRDWGTENHMDTYSNMWDLQNKIIDLETAQKINKILVPKTRPDLEPQKHWLVFSPTVGLTYDVFGDGKTIAKASWRMFPGSGWGYGAWAPTGTGGWSTFEWIDFDNNYKVNWQELYWRTNTSVRTAYPVWLADGTLNTSRINTDKGTTWGGFEWDNPLALTQPYAVYDWDNLKVSLTHDVSVSLERQFTQDISASVTFSYRRYGRYTRSLSYYPAAAFPTISDPNHKRAASDYEIVWKVPDTLVDPTTGKTFDPKEAKGRDIWAGKNVDYVTTSTSWSWNEMADPSARDAYWGWDFVFNKRLSKKWMFNGSFSWQTQRTYYGDNYIGNETNRWAYDGQMWASSLGTNSGKPSGGNFFSRWMVKLMGMYQLPWDANISFTLSGHEGGWVGESFNLYNYYSVPNQTNGYSWGIPTTAYDGRIRLDTVWTLNLKIEKMLKIGDVGRIYFSGDIFNALNQTPVLRQYDNVYGSFYLQKAGNWTYTAPSATNFLPSEIMNPYVFRLGVRFQI